ENANNVIAETETGNGVGSTPEDKQNNDEGEGNASEGEDDKPKGKGEDGKFKTGLAKIKIGLTKIKNIFVKSEGENSASKDDSEAGNGVGSTPESQVSESEGKGNASTDETETGNDVGSTSEDEHGKSEDGNNASKDEASKPKAQVVETGDDASKNGDDASEAPPSGLLQRLMGTLRSFVCRPSIWNCGQDTKKTTGGRADS
ncbi:hypothetical protein BASA62_006950, partial [Batrachochytrium salamandrivorans]